MTDMTEREKDGEVLKADTRGRVRTSEERREALLDEFEKSGVSGARFAALVGVNYQTFAGWVHRRRKQRGGQSTEPSPTEHKSTSVEASQPVRWLEAVVEGTGVSAMAAAGGVALWVHLPGGARLEIGNSGQVALATELLCSLEKSANRGTSC